MSHCVHFLQRLERVSMTDADFALELYRNPELVRMLMTEFSDYYDEDRAALALGENGAGPYVVIAVDGGFVTCLGENMKPRGLKVIRRELLESRRVFDEEFSEAVKRFRRLNKEGGTTRLFRRVVGNGQLVCREDVEQIIAVLPAVQMNFIGHISEMSRMVLHDRGTLLYVMDGQRRMGRKIAELKRMGERVASTHWTGAWSIATCHAVVAAGGEHSLMSMYFTESDELGPVHAVSLVEGHSGLALRSLWGAGMRGPAVVGLYETHLHRVELAQQVVGNIASLTIATLRYPELRERVHKHLEEIRRVHGGYAKIDFALACAYGVMGDDLQPFYDTQLALGREVYRGVRRSLSPNHPAYYKDSADVPEALLCTLAITFSSYFHSSNEALAGMFACLPWLAKASIGDLFLPRNLNNTLLAVGPTSAELGLEMLYAQLLEPDSQEPFVNEETIGRNERCPCQSGRKYKQCCLNREVKPPAENWEMWSQA